MAVTDDQAQTTASQALLARARAGDAPASCRLIEPLQARLLRQAAALNGDLGLAEELVSETRIRAWRYLSRYNETCRLSTWLYAILLHCHQEAARRARSRPASLARRPLSEARALLQQHERHYSSEPSPADAAAQKDTVIGPEIHFVPGDGLLAAWTRPDQARTAEPPKPPAPRPKSERPLHNGRA